MLFIRNSDQSKYGSLTSKLTTDYALGNNAYPATVETAVAILEQHKFDQTHYDKRKKRQNKEQLAAGQDKRN